MASDDESELLYPPTSTVNPFTIANGQAERAQSPGSSLHLPHKTRYRNKRRPPVYQSQLPLERPLKKQKIVSQSSQNNRPLTSIPTSESYSEPINNKDNWAPDIDIKPSVQDEDRTTAQQSQTSSISEQIRSTRPLTSWLHQEITVILDNRVQKWKCNYCSRR